MRRSTTWVWPWLAVLAALLGAAGCDAGAAGSFEVVFAWADEAPTEPVWVLARIEQRSSGDDNAIIVAEAPLTRYGEGRNLTFGDLAYGRDLVVVVEIKQAPDRVSRTLYHGESDPFALRAGQHTQVPVRLHLTRTPDVDDPEGAVRIEQPQPVEGIIPSALVTLSLAANHATRVEVANDQSFSMGASEVALADLAQAGERFLWPEWDLDAGLCAQPPCADGPRRVFVRFANDAGYMSDIYSAQVIIDRVGPLVTGANLIRAPFFGPAVDEGQTWFCSRDPHSGQPVEAVLYVYADEPLANEPTLRCTEAGGASLAFTFDAGDSRLDTGIASFRHVLDPAAPAPDGDYVFEVSWADGLGNAVDRIVPATLRMHDLPPDGGVDLDQTVYRRAEWGDDASAGAPTFSLRGQVSAPAMNDVVEVLILAAADLDLGYRMGVAPVDDQGRFSVDALPAFGVSRVFLAPVGRSGSLGPIQGVRFVEWLATLGQEEPGRDHPNPHAFRAWSRRPLGLSETFGLTASEYGHAELGQADGQVALVEGRALWRQTTSNLWNPHAENYAAMVYDSARARLVQFGGDLNPGAVDETWEWDGENWDLLFPPVAPAPRSRHAMAYDRVRGVTVLFGGNATVLDDQTWEWDGQAWILREAVGPSAREDHGMVYDSARGRVVLFGGDRGPAAGGQDDGTWEWDGQAWVERQPAHAPSARQGQAMAYDAARQRVVLFGGAVGGDADAETWEWDGQTWERRCDGDPASDVCPAAPTARRHAAMAYDARRGVSVLYGGWVDACLPTACRSDEVWEWDGQTWTQRCDGAPADDLCGDGPPAAIFHTLAYDEARGRVVFSGTAAGGSGSETWEFDGRKWADRTALNPIGRYRHAMTWDPTGDRILLFGGLTSQGYNADTWIWDGGWRQLAPTQSPSARNEHALAADWERGSVILYGGNPGPTEMWEWDGDDWSPLTPALSPGERSRHAMATDAARGRVVLFGGQHGGLRSDETWEWYADNWHQPNLSPSPTARWRHAMAFDLARGEVVLFGGETDTGRSDETWLYDGAWRLATPTQRPPARDSHTLAYDPDRGKTVLFGGSDDTGQYLDDMWEWDGSDWTEVDPTQRPTGRIWHAMHYHSGRGQMLLFGGPNDQSVETWVLDYAPTAPGQIFAVDLGALDPGGQSDAAILGLAAQAVAGGSSELDRGPVHADGSACLPALEPCLAGQEPEPGAVLSLWWSGAWLALASNAAEAEAPEWLEWTASVPADLSADSIGDKLHLALTPVGQNGSGLARLATDYIALAIRLCHGGPSVCDAAAFPE